MKIILHSGAGVNDGTCIELVSGRSRILLDCGASQGAALPDIPGLHAASPLPLSGILISHTHFDHYGALFDRPVLPGVKVFMTEIMEDVMRITSKLSPVYRKLQADLRYFSRGRKFILGRFVITPYLMDHSAAESYAFIIESEGERLIYTGDYREHGGKGGAFKKLLAADAGPVDVLITEGALAGVDKGPSAQETADDIQGLLTGRDGALFVMCSGQDVDMLTSLASVAGNTGRFLLVDGYVALLLERIRNLALNQGVELKSPCLDTECLRVMDNDLTKKLSRLSEYSETYRRMRRRIVSWDWVRGNQGKLIIPVRAGSETWVKEQLKDLSCAALVYSVWKDHGKEAGLRGAFDYFAGSVTKIGMRYSGHAYFSAIRKVVENKRPRFILPVNTADGDKFAATYGKRVRLLGNGGEFAVPGPER